MMRLIKYALWSLVGIVLIVGGVLFAVVATERGSRFAIVRTVDAVPGVTLDSVAGSLWRGIELDGVRYDDAQGTRVDVGFVRLAVDWPALAERRAHVRELVVRDVDVRLPDSEEVREPSAGIDPEALIPEIPLALRVDHLLVERLRVQPGPEAEAIVVDTLQLRAGVDAERAVVEALSLALSAPLELETGLSATLEMTAPFRLNATLDGHARVEQGRAAWSLESGGPLERLDTRGGFDWFSDALPDARVRVDVSHGFDSAVLNALEVESLEGQLQLGGEVSWAEGVAWEIDAVAQGFDLSSFVPEADQAVGVAVRSQGHMAADGELRHETRIRDGEAGFDGIEIRGLRAELAGGLDRVEIRDLALDVLGGAIAGTARLEWGEALGWNLALSATGLEPGRMVETIDGQLAFRIESAGRLDAEGQLNHRTRLDGVAGALAAITFADLGLTVSGDLQRILVDDLTGTILGARLAGGATVDLAEERIGWDARFSVDEADLGLLAEHIEPPLSGRVGFDIESRGELRDGAPHLVARVERLRGTVQDQVLAGSVLAEVAGERVRLEPAELVLGENRLRARGQVTPPFDFEYEIALPSLAALPVPTELGLAGRVDGEGRVRGTLEAPQVDARLAARGLAFQDHRVAALDLRARLEGEVVDVELDVTDIHAADQRVERMGLVADGTLADHRLGVNATSADFGRLGVALAGGLAEDVWTGVLESLSVQGTPAGDWALTEAAALSASAEAFSLARSCLAEVLTPAADGREPGTVCVRAERDRQGLIVADTELRLPLAMLDSVLPPTVELPGLLTGRAQARVGEEVRVDAELALPDHHLLAREIGDETLTIAYRDVRVQAELRGQALRATLAAELPDYLTLAGEVSAALDGDQALSGDLRMNMPDLSWLNAFVPALSEMRGAARADFVLGGTLSAPVPEGALRVEGLALTVPDTGVAYHGGEIELRVDPAQRFDLSGSLSGLESGVLRIDGSGALVDPDGWSVDIEVSGEDFPVMRMPDMTVDISPAIAVTADARAATVRGRILVPLAEIAVRTLPEGSVAESSDLVLVEEEDEAAGAYPVRTDVEIVLGDRIRLEGMGFSTRLSGQIRLRGDETAPIAAFGEVDLVDGGYVAYGQNLTVDQGRLSFNGPLDDPGLDVRASRTVGEYQAGLEIRGTLGNPTSQVFSVPALPESDALSLLLTGRLLSAGTSGADANLLVNALAGLGIAQGDEIVRDIGQQVGFDELGLDTENGLEGTQLTVGKRLNSRLMVRYAVGVFDGVGRFITEYNINRFLDLQIVSSAQSQGGDLIFRLER